jgi:signal transduction histidine kinase/DNA-binding response OmpR family regulator/streptogramin lyase
MLHFMRKKWVNSCNLIIALLSFALHITAQTTIQNNITIDDGLINNEVTAIHQDSYGFIWLGTRGGLNKYNGYDFNTIRSTSGSINNLSNQAVEVIAEYKHTLWIGNKTGGLSSYDFISDSIIHYTPPASVKIQEIKSLYADNTGNLFIGSLHGLYLFKKGEFITIDKNLTVNALVQDDKGVLWVGSVAGLYKYDPQIKNLQPAQFGIKPLDITSLAINNQTGTLFIGTWGKGLVKYSIQNQSFVKYLSSNTAGGLASNNTYRVLIDRSQNVWVGTWGGGLSRFNTSTETFEKIRIKPGDVYNNDYDIILSIVQDRTGILWIGTDGGGVCKLDPYRKKFNAITNFSADKAILDNTHITAVYEDKNNGLWLGTKGGGLRFSADKKQFVQKGLGIKTIRVNTFFENNQELWMGTADGLVIFKDFQRSSKPLLIKSSNTDTTALSGPKITAIVKDKNGIIWVGTQEHGLNKLVSFKNGIPFFKRYPEKVGVAGAIQNNRISCMLVDKNNRLWVGTYDGLHLYDRENDRFKVIKPDNNIDKGLSNNTILSLAEDSYGSLWVGTQQGLNKLSFSDNGQLSIESFYQSPGFPNDYIHAVLIDYSNNIWMGTNKGLTKYNIQNKNFRNFDTRDGVSSNTFSENACFLKPDGQMFFGGIDGITYFYPDSIYFNHYKPPVYITQLKINNQDVKVGKVITVDEILTSALFLTKKIKLSYKENIISISYAALDYHASDKNQYQYKLENFDKVWVNAGNNRTVSYTNLPSGSYTFKVRASNSDQTWNENIAVLEIAILPPPWKTWWAYLIYFLVISGVLWLSRYMKLKRIYLQNRLQIANLNYEKAHEIAEIKNKFFTNISHEFRTPLTLMMGPLEDLSADFNIEPVVRNTIRKIQNQSKRLLSLINQLLDFHKAEANVLKLNTSYQDIVALSKFISASFEEEAARKGIQFSFTSNRKEIYLSIDKEKVESIIYNLLSNAFKFTQAGGEISFAVNYVKTPQHLCEVIVADTGKGIGEEEKEKIFDRFYQVAQAEPGKYVGTGIGLAFVKDLIELHKGSIHLQNNQPHGSIFTMTLPAAEARQQEYDTILEEESRPNNQSENDNTESDKEDLPILLVVEDNEELNQYICKVLSKCGEVISAKDGKEGLEKAFQTIPDLVISDVMMPEIDGYQLCKKVKEDNRTSHIPVILLTAKSDDLSHIEGIQLGADIYLGKPFKPAILMSHVKNLIKSRKKLKELFANRLNLEPSEVEAVSFNEEFIKRAILFVEENLENDDFSIDELATQLNMSRSTFYRKLKALTGISGSDFIRMIKLKRSAQLLKTGEYTVSMAAYNAGFNDLKHFRKSFQKQFGITPSEYMKQKD